MFPFLGYFQLIKAVDIFVFYDDVHFIKKGFINRNALLINGERRSFTIPCSKVSQNRLINRTELNFTEKDKLKFLRSIQLAYAKAPQFKEFYSLLDQFILSDDSKTISDFASQSIIFICKYLKVETKLLFSSDHFSDSRGMEKSTRLMKISKDLEATHYVNAIGGKELYDKDVFSNCNLILQFLEPKNIIYNQFKNEFIPWLSIIDVLMFNTVEESQYLLEKYNLV